MPIPLGILAAAGAGGSFALVDSFDLLTTTLISSNTSSVTFSNLGSYSDYKHLQIRATARNSSSGFTGLRDLLIRFNSDSGSNYTRHVLHGDGSSIASFPSTLASSTYAFNCVPDDDFGGSIYGAAVIDILDFSNSSKNTTIRALSGAHWDVRRIAVGSGLWINTAAVTSITLLPSSGQFISGSRLSLYGIK